MLMLDKSLGCIQTSESAVLDLFQSSPVEIKLTGHRPEPRTAYVCAVKKNSNVQVYVALAAEHGRSFVYTKPDSSDSDKDYHESLEHALGFVRSMGFTPERVNLEYSPAMRAVVVRNFKIFNFPGSKQAAAAPNLAHQKSPVAQLESPIPSPIPVVPLASVASVASVAAVASVAKTASVMTKKDQKEQESINEVIVKLATEMKALRDERDALSVNVQELTAAQLGVTAELKTAKGENSKLLTEKDKLAQTAVAMDNISSDLALAQKEVARLAQDRDGVKRRVEDLVAENAGLMESVARAQEEAAKANEGVAQSEEEATRAKEEATRAKEEATKAKEEATKAKEEATKAKEEATKAKEEATKAKEEAAAAQEGAVKAREEAARAREEAAKSEEDAVKANKEAAKAIKERDVAARRAEELLQGKDRNGLEVQELLFSIEAVSAERDELLSRVEKLEQQVEAKDAELGGARAELTALVAEREKLLVVLEQTSMMTAPRSKVATATVEAEEAASDRLMPNTSLEADTCERGQLEPFVPAFVLAPEEPESAAVGMTEDSWPVLGETAIMAFDERSVAETAVAMMTVPSFGSDPFLGFGPAVDGLSDGFSGESEETFLFMLENDRTSIDYGAPEDVVQIQKSYNQAYVAPDGKAPESCEGYICCVRMNEHLQVYAAIHGVQSGRVGVYGPARCTDEGGLAAAVAGAIAFHEQVGLMMERVDVGGELIANCPVLRRLEPDTAMKKAVGYSLAN
jgi:hypothetical protein